MPISLVAPTSSLNNNNEIGARKFLPDRLIGSGGRGIFSKGEVPWRFPPVNRFDP